MSEIAATNTIDVTPSARPVPGSASSLVGRAKGLAAQPAVAKSLPAIGFVALIALAALLYMAFSAAPGRTLFSGLPDADKAAVVEALEGAGIAHSIDSGTGALTVSEEDYHQARMLLAGQGLPRGAPDGTEMMNDLPLGASRAVEGERIRASRQTDLARTIEAIDAVRSARVHIADQGQSVFVRDRAAPAASIMLTLEPGRTLSDGQVQAIVHLAASSVPGLNPEGVSVVDQNGRLLSRAGGSADSATSESERQIGIQGQIQDRYRQAIAALLTPIVGAGNFTAEVHAEMDFSQVEASREAYPEASRALRQEQGAVSTETGSAASAVGGIPGALANEAPAPATAATDPNAPPVAVPGAAQETRRNEQYNRNYAVGREISVTRNQTGTVKRLSVAVALRNPEGGRALTRDELQAMENLVRGAVGYNQERGDSVAITARAFAAEEAGAVPAWWEELVNSPLARSLIGLLVAALVVFGLGRPLMKRMSAASAKRAEEKSEVGQQIAAALAGQAKSDGNQVTIDMIEAAPSYEARAALIRSFVRQDPARAALVVRDLIRADTRPGTSHG